MDTGSYLALLGFIAANTVAASSGAFFRPDQWYAALTKPSWTPPNWLFPPAWMVLYAVIAYAGWRVWYLAGFDGALLALVFYAIQLVLNGMWSWLFFGLRRPDLAFIEVVFLWLSVVGMIVTFHPIDPLSSSLMIVYLAWVSFAAALNFAVWRLNAETLRAARAT